MVRVVERGLNPICSSWFKDLSMVYLQACGSSHLWLKSPNATPTMVDVSNGCISRRDCQVEAVKWLMVGGQLSRDWKLHSWLFIYLPSYVHWLVAAPSVLYALPCCIFLYGRQPDKLLRLEIWMRFLKTKGGSLFIKRVFIKLTLSSFHKAFFLLCEEERESL
jgi:hypothetical protein